MYTLTLSELADLHHFIMGSLKRLKDEDGNLPYDHVSERRYDTGFDAGVVVINEMLACHYSDHS